MGMDEARGGHGTAAGRGMTLLSVESVSRRHRVGRETITVLRDASLDVQPAEVVAIRGGRRAGKTTLLRIAAGIEPPDTGRTRLEGEDINALAPSERTRRMRQIGYVPQTWRVAPGKPAIDHVALPLLAQGRPLHTAMAKAHETLQRVGASDCATAATHELSVADRVRVMLAQALVSNPRVLLVDEPGAKAEAADREQLMHLLRSIAADREGLALVLTSQDIAGLSGADRVLSIHRGRLRALEEPAEIIPLPARSSVSASPA